MAIVEAVTNRTASTRREQILAIAAELFAEKGFHGVSIAELGAACGFSGPALYRHFRSKDAVLAEMLVSISDELLTEGRAAGARRRRRRGGARALVDWHVTFALDHKALIVVQDRDWSALPLEAREKVRDTQRKYVEVWVKQLRAIRPELAAASGPGQPCTRRSACSTPPPTAPSSRPRRCACCCRRWPRKALGLRRPSGSERRRLRAAG